MNYSNKQLPQKALIRFILGGITVTLCMLFGPDATALAASPGGIGNTYTWLTIFMVVTGSIIFVVYINSMFTVLQETAASYSEVEEEDGPTFYYATPVLGAIAAAVIAALVIWLYGKAPIFLYLGPFLCLISPLAIIYCMSRDIQAFKATHLNGVSSVEDPLTKTLER